MSSTKLNLSGYCDIVEARSSSPRFSLQHLTSITPIEYKRGKPKAHRADEVQVCAQALCLEEMFQFPISHGLIFYGQKMRRTEIPLDTDLRNLTLDVIQKNHELFESGITPQAHYEKSRCSNCSLLNICMPKTRDRRTSAANWFNDTILSSPNR